jgi:hypothetical protein
MGVSKEMRLHGKWGERHIALSQHFHHFCDESFVDLNSSVKTMIVCSNITEMVAHLLLGHAIGPKQQSTKSMHDPLYAENSVDASLRYCNACPKHMLPLHITPCPKMTFHNRTYTEQLSSVCKPTKQDICPGRYLKLCVIRKLAPKFCRYVGRVSTLKYVPKVRMLVGRPKNLF